MELCRGRTGFGALRLDWGRMRDLVLTLMGPTACGKTGLAVWLAQQLAQHQNLPVEIISVDSALVYRGMDIGTAKPTQAERAGVPHYLIDIVDPHEPYSAARFREDALRLIGEIHARGAMPLLAGGTMLYFHALKHGMDDLPEADPALRAELEARSAQVGWPALHAELAQLDPVTAARLSPNDSQRIQRALEVCIQSGQPMSSLLQGQKHPPLPFTLREIILLPSDRAVLHQRIAERFDLMLEAGFVEEVRHLLTDARLTPDLPSMRSVGYRQAIDFIRGEMDAAAFRDQSIAATRQLAKRQITWLRGWEDAKVFDCLDLATPGATLAAVDAWLQEILV